MTGSYYESITIGMTTGLQSYLNYVTGSYYESITTGMSIGLQILANIVNFR
ncbi:hypothetical protein GCM10011414_20830 [Croceivirga lutea]|nr:hypothetical protein GCM10011414_20830 [Croceivirga lutea]